MAEAWVKTVSFSFLSFADFTHMLDILEVPKNGQPKAAGIKTPIPSPKHDFDVESHDPRSSAEFKNLHGDDQPLLNSPGITAEYRSSDDAAMASDDTATSSQSGKSDSIPALPESTEEAASSDPEVQDGAIQRVLTRILDWLASLWASLFAKPKQE